MSNLVLDLIKLLQEQNSYIQKLLHLSKVETEALTENQFDKLYEVVKEQENLSRFLQLLEEKRQRLQSELSTSFELEEVNISNLSASLDANLAKELDKVSSLLKDNYLKLQEINQLNVMLIKQGLSYVTRMQDALTPAENKTYGKKGNSTNESTFIGTVDKSV